MSTTNASIATTARIIRTRAARTRIGHHMSLARRYAVLDALIARTNGAFTTVAEYLANVVGADEKFLYSYSPSFGRFVAKAYRAKFNAEPKQGLTRRGLRLFDGFVYAADEMLVLDETARSYGRTADLVNA
jgi:hypothetical protein